MASYENRFNVISEDKTFTGAVTNQGARINGIDNEIVLPTDTYSSLDVTNASRITVGNATVTINNFLNGIEGQILTIVMLSSAGILTLTSGDASSPNDYMLIDGGTRVYTGYGAIQLIKRGTIWFIFEGAAH